MRSQGPGGQNVNNVASAVQLRVFVERLGLPGDVGRRLLRLAGRRATAGGEIVIEAHRHRSQARNREEAMTRLLDLVSRARRVPRLRIATRASRAARARRLDAKNRRGRLKRLRRGPALE